MKHLNELEQSLYDWLKTNALPKQIKKNLFLDYKKVFNRYIPILHKAANKCKKNPTGWTTDALNIDKNWFNRHQWE